MYGRHVNLHLNLDGDAQGGENEKIGVVSRLHCLQCNSYSARYDLSAHTDSYPATYLAWLDHARMASLDSESANRHSLNQPRNFSRT